MPSSILASLRPEYSLRFSLLAYVVLPLTGALALGWAVALSHIESVSEERMQEEVQLVARAIQLPLSRALDQGSGGGVQQSLESAFRIGRVYGAYVYGSEGAVIAAAGFVRPEAPRERMLSLMKGGDRKGEYGEAEGRRIYSYFVPLTDPGGRINGILQVTRRRRDFDAYIAGLRWQAILVLLASTLGMVGLVFWGHHRALGRHVERLAKDMGHIQKGSRDHRAEAAGPREITNLAVSLNAMLDSLARSEQEIVARRISQATLEARLRQAEKLAALGQLAAGVAHELGTPLSVIDGQAQRALRRSPLPEGHVAALHQIRQQVSRMEEIVRQLLDFGRGWKTQLRQVTLDRIAQRSVGTVQGLARRHRVSLHCQGADSGVALETDPLALEQTLANLLRNAIQAAPGGNVCLRCGDAGSEVYFVVEDDGPGVPEEMRARIFEPFFTTKAVGQGTGLGLALAHRVVEDLQGMIQVGESELGGARFEIRIPRNCGGNVAGDA